MKATKNKVSRRSWLTKAGFGLMGLFFFKANDPIYKNQTADCTPGSDMFNRSPGKTNPVSLVKGDDHYQIVYQSLKNIENEVIKSIGRKKILIKPNLVTGNSPSSVTDPIAVKAILDFLKPHYKKQIIIGESTADSSRQRTTIDLFNQYGYLGFAKDYNVKFIDLNKEEFEYRYILGAHNTPKYIRISKPFLDPGIYIISAAKMKTHYHCIVTLALKNVLMAAPINDYTKHNWTQGDKFDMHVTVEAEVHAPLFYNMFQMAHYVYPDLAVIDGFVGMEGNGPTGGTDINSRVAIASLDALAADTVGAKVMGFDPEIIPYLKFLKQGGFGQGNISEIKVIGASIDQCMMKFKPSDASAKAFNLS